MLGVDTMVGGKYDASYLHVILRGTIQALMF